MSDAPESIGAQVGDVVFVFRPGDESTAIRAQEVIKAALREAGILPAATTEFVYRDGLSLLEEAKTHPPARPRLIAIGRLGRSGWIKGRTK